MSAAPAFTTRAEADPRNRLIEAMAEGYYEAEKPRGSSLPPWRDALPAYQEAVRRGIGGALAAMERAGWKVVAP